MPYTRVVGRLHVESSASSSSSIFYKGHEIVGYKKLKIVDIRMRFSNSWWELFPRTSRYIGFFEPDGIMVEEHWNTGKHETINPPEFKRILEEFDRAVNEYVEKNGLIRHTPLPKI